MHRTQPPIGAPVHGIGFLDACRRLWSGAVVFEGKASRGEFWFGALVVVGVFVGVVVGAQLVGLAVTGGSGLSVDVVGQRDGTPAVAVVVAVVASIVMLAVQIPLFAVWSRRLRDAGLSPWLVLLVLVGAGIVPLVMAAMPSKEAVPG